MKHCRRLISSHFTCCSSLARSHPGSSACPLNLPPNSCSHCLPTALSTDVAMALRASRSVAGCLRLTRAPTHRIHSWAMATGWHHRAAHGSSPDAKRLPGGRTKTLPARLLSAVSATAPQGPRNKQQLHPDSQPPQTTVAMLGAGDISNLHAAAIRQLPSARLGGLWSRWVGGVSPGKKFPGTLTSGHAASCPRVYTPVRLQRVTFTCRRTIARCCMVCACL